EYELWATWTAMRADKEGEAKHVPAVKALAEKAIEQDPSLGFAYFVLGHLSLRSFDAVRARELFAKARALDPATTSAAKDVRLKNAATKDDDAKPAAAAAAAAAAAKEAPPEPPPAASETSSEASSEASAADAAPTELAARVSTPGGARPPSRRNVLVAI